MDRNMSMAGRLTRRSPSPSRGGGGGGGSKLRMDRKPSHVRITDPSHPAGKRKEIDNVMRKARAFPNETWDKKLLEAEEKDPNRWRHTGFKKMYIEEDASSSDSDAGPQRPPPGRYGNGGGGGPPGRRSRSRSRSPMMRHRRSPSPLPETASPEANASAVAAGISSQVPRGTPDGIATTTWARSRSNVSVATTEGTPEAATIAAAEGKC
ncbi:hypothetical protein quinque_000689 [Culex quinquefasciatus]